MNNFLTNPFIFLIQVIFGLYVTVVLLRFLFQLLRVDFYNPISQAIVKLTNPPLRILRRLIPSIGQIDTSSIILMLIVQFTAFALVALIVGGTILPVSLLAYSAVEILNHTFNIFIFSIIVLAILSWISPPHSYNPVAVLLNQLTAPLMQPARRLIPPMGGLDLSPMLVIIALFFFKLLIIPPLQYATKLIPL